MNQFHSLVTKVLNVICKMSKRVNKYQLQLKKKNIEYIKKRVFINPEVSASNFIKKTTQNQQIL